MGFSPEILRLIRERRDRDRRGPREFVEAMKSGDLERYGKAFGRMARSLDGWRRAMIRLSKEHDLPLSTRRAFMWGWSISGDYIRLEVGSDLILLNALWAIVPHRYSGGSLTLYRGDGWGNRKHRTYGMSWSTSQEVAESFAAGIWRKTEGGSVVLRTVAPASAILCRCESGAHDEEDEYLVDRRRLGTVDLIKRYSQVDVNDQPCESLSANLICSV